MTRCQLGILVGLVALGSLAFGAQHSAEVKAYHGKPTLFVDGQVALPAFYALTHAYGARWSWEEVPQRNLKSFGDLGFRLFQLDLYLEDLWPKNAETLNLDKAVRQIRGLLDVVPGACVVLRVHVNAPFWWNEAHREECTEYADAPVDRRAYGPPFNLEDGDIDHPLRASLASRVWRETAGQKLAELCRRLSALPEGDAVIGFHISGGVYGEWHYWGFPDHDPDVGPAMTNYFREWLRAKYQEDGALQEAWGSQQFTLADATVPNQAERDFSDDGIFRDPTREQRVIDYFTAQHQVVAEDIEDFTGIVKRTWPRPAIVGVFYGYLHMTFNRQAAGGHLAIQRILDCPTIDYLAAPQSYWGQTQGLGGSGNSRGIVESTLLHGKLWLDELDNGHLQKSGKGDAARSSGRFDAAYFPVLRRSAVLPLMRGAGLWYYDFGPRESFGWWDDPAYLRDIRATRDAFEQRLEKPYESAADVLYVWDQESFLYVKSKRTPVGYSLLDEAAEEALRSGTAGDHVYLFDLPNIELRRYRAIVFMNVYKMTAAQRAFVRTDVARDGRTLIWNYLPGYTDGQSNQLAFVEELTGFKLAWRPPSATAPSVQFTANDVYHFEGPVVPMAAINEPGAVVLARLTDTGEPVVVRKPTREATIVYSTLPLHGTSFFRELFRHAGCHIYNEADDFTYANSSLLMVHSKNGGQRQLRLRNGTRTEAVLPPRSTFVFDTVTGQPVLK